MDINSSGTGGLEDDGGIKGGVALNDESEVGDDHGLGGGGP